MSREYEAKIEIENPQGGDDIKVTVLGKFEDGELEDFRVYAPEGLDLTTEQKDVAIQALYDEMQRVQENGYQGD